MSDYPLPTTQYHPIVLLTLASDSNVLIMSTIMSAQLITITVGEIQLSTMATNIIKKNWACPITKLSATVSKVL